MNNIKRATKLRPKGYNLKVWLVCWEEAEADKKWAEDTVRNNPEWCKNASDASLGMLGERLSQLEYDLAKSSYDYLEMRSHGDTCVGSLDQTARDKWEQITGRKIPSKNQWKYDHWIGITSARKVNGKWLHPYKDEPIKTGAK